jgi:hypothetical protein
LVESSIICQSHRLNHVASPRLPCGRPKQAAQWSSLALRAAEAGRAVVFTACRACTAFGLPSLAVGRPPSPSRAPRLRSKGHGSLQWLLRGGRRLGDDGRRRRWQTTVVTCWLCGRERWGLIVRWCVAPRDVARDETLNKSRVSASCWFDRGVEGENFRHPSARKVGSI